MRLLLDAGNTRIKWQLRDGSNVLQQGAGELEALRLFEGMTDAQWQAVDAVAVSTVRSESARDDLSRVLGQYSPVPVRFFWTRPRFGPVTCAYNDPATMGADRWHALIGAWERVQGGCVVVDAGSAVTLDWLDDQGRHLGGYILPGRAMMLKSLRQSTARVVFEPGENLAATSPGQSTAECVFHGVNWLIQALARQLDNDAGGPVLVTGGDGALIMKALADGVGGSRNAAYLCPDLVLDGLALVEAG